MTKFEKGKKYNVRFRTNGNIFGELEVLKTSDDELKFTGFGVNKSWDIPVKINGKRYKASLYKIDEHHDFESIRILKSNGMCFDRYTIVKATDEAI